MTLVAGFIVLPTRFLDLDHAKIAKRTTSRHNIYIRCRRLLLLMQLLPALLVLLAPLHAQPPLVFTRLFLLELDTPHPPVLKGWPLPLAHPRPAKIRITLLRQSRIPILQLHPGMLLYPLAPLPRNKPLKIEYNSNNPIFFGLPFSI